MQVDVIDMPELRVATVSHRGSYNTISGAFKRLGEIAGGGGLFGPSATMMGIYYDDPENTPVAELRSEAAVTLAPGARVPEGLGEARIPAGRYARTTYVGPYEKLPEVWGRLMEWLPQSGHDTRDGASLEIYRNIPGEVPDDKLITELYVAIT